MAKPIKFAEANVTWAAQGDDIGDLASYREEGVQRVLLEDGVAGAHPGAVDGPCLAARLGRGSPCGLCEHRLPVQGRRP